MGIARDDRADTWRGHNTNWENMSFSSAGQRLICFKSCCMPTGRIGALMMRWAARLATRPTDAVSPAIHIVRQACREM